MAIKETTIQISDLDDVINVLQMVGNYFSAQDFLDAQRQLRNTTKSPISSEIEPVLEKMKAILGDYLREEHLAGLEASEPVEDEFEDYEVDDDLEGAENGSEELPEASEGDDEQTDAEVDYEPPPTHVLGEFKPPKQEGRVLGPDEI